MIALTIGTIGPIAVAFLLLQRTGVRGLGVAVSLAAAFAFGAGASSLVWWGLLHLPFRSADGLATADAAVWGLILLGVGAGRLRRRRVGPVLRMFWLLPDRRRGLLPALIIFLPVCAVAVATFAAWSLVVPLGSWDAWAIWNARARFLFLGFPAWQDGLLPPAAHADYPLLLPISVARIWALLGRDAAVVPIVVGAMFAASVVIVLGASIAKSVSVPKGLLAASFLLASPAFVDWSPAEIADVPLSLYVLLALVLSAAATSTADRSLWGLAGLSAGLAAWTKNEGILFVVVFTLVQLVVAGRAHDGNNRWRSLGALVAGAALSLLVVAAFKGSIEGSNDLVRGLSLRSVRERAGDLTRLWMVTSAFGRELWFGGATIVGVLPVLAAYVAMTGVSVRTGPAISALATLGIMLVAYAAVYALMAVSVTWQVQTSLSRVVLQLTPSIVWAGMMLTTPDLRDAGSRSSA